MCRVAKMVSRRPIFVGYGPQYGATRGTPPERGMLGTMVL